MSDDDGPLIIPPRPGPVAAGQAAMVALHIADGLLLIAVAQLLPAAWIPVEGVGDTLSTPRLWASGVVLFATFVACAVSSFFTVVSFRTVTAFRKLPSARARVALIAGTLVANAIGCTAALIAVTLWITSTLVGDVHLMK